jgi:hypothetical protein
MNDFSVDLQNELDFPLAQMPQDPDVGENWGFWLFDENGSIGVHSHVQREKGFWNHCREYVHVFYAMGAISGFGEAADYPPSTAQAAPILKPPALSRFGTGDMNLRALPTRHFRKRQFPGRCRIIVLNARLSRSISH